MEWTQRLLYAAMDMAMAMRDWNGKIEGRLFLYVLSMAD